MAAIIRAEVTFPYTSGIPRDISMNVLHFLLPDDPISDDFVAISDAIIGFYNEPQLGSTFAIGELFSAVISRGEDDCSIVFSNVDDDPELPLLTSNFTLVGVLSDVESSLPLEVAICASIRATPAFPVPVRRRTGRIYLGPLMNETLTLTPGGFPEVGAETRANICNAVQWLASDDTLDVQRLAVYSRVDGQAYEVSQGWVDNEPDTQRRRQMDPTVRTTWSI